MNTDSSMWSRKIPFERLSWNWVDKIPEMDNNNIFKKVADIPYILLDFLLLSKLIFFSVTSFVVGLRSLEFCTYGSKHWEKLIVVLILKTRISSMVVK